MNDEALVGQRVLLRRLCVDDLADFQAYRCDPDVGRYQGWTAQSDGIALAFLARMQAAEFCAQDAWFQLGIARREDGRLIGDIGICRRAEETEIGFSLATAAQGQGLASEALRLLISLLFEQLKVKTIVAITDALNDASIRLLRRLGGRLAGTQSALFRGQPCLEHHFVIDRPQALNQ